jgi:hypothetical protein
MVRFQPGECPYCGHGFVYASAKRRRAAIPLRADTIDHVYPITIQVPNGLTRHALLNRLRCCYDCNQRKANMHPLRWLTLIEDPTRRQDFAALLLKLGEAPKLVQHALEWQNGNPRIP